MPVPDTPHAPRAECQVQPQRGVQHCPAEAGQQAGRGGVRRGHSSTGASPLPTLGAQQTRTECRESSWRSPPVGLAKHSPSHCGCVCFRSLACRRVDHRPSFLVQRLPGCAADHGTVHRHPGRREGDGVDTLQSGRARDAGPASRAGLQVGQPGPLGRNRRQVRARPLARPWAHSPLALAAALVLHLP